MIIFCRRNQDFQLNVKYFILISTNCNVDTPVERSHDSADEKMVLSVYGMNYSDIESALHRVEQLCKEAEKTQVIRHADVSKLSPDQVQLITLNSSSILGY